MISLVIKKYGDLKQSLEFQEIPVPVIQPNQLLIRTQAASFNPLYYKIVRGDFKEGARSFQQDAKTKNGEAIPPGLFSNTLSTDELLQTK